MQKTASVKPRFEKVLLVDEDQIDNFINERMILTNSFANEVLVKFSAMEALEYLTEMAVSDAEQLPDVVFLDLNMPIMDGFEFLEEYDKLLKKHPQLSKCKIIVLSSSISPADIDRASSNPHVSKYLNKPLTDKYLTAINF